MFFRNKIIRWNLTSLLASLLLSLITGAVAARMLALRYFGQGHNVEEMLRNPMLRPFAMRLAFVVVISLVLYLLLTNLVVYYKVSKEIIRPLRELRDTTREMAQGNFDSCFSGQTMGEVGDIASYLETTQNRLRQYVKELNEQKQANLELMTSISHDLRTPITTILGYTDGILDNVADTDEKKEKYLRRIRQKTVDLQDLIDQLLFSSKLDLNKVSYNLERTNAAAWVKEIIDEIKIDLDKNQMEVLFPLALPEMMVMLDKNRFKRVVLNIITNAIKYKKPGDGKIIIDFQKAIGSLVIGFSDDGIGIAKEKLPYIFDSFYRADASRTDTGTSSGLGLSICKLIIEGHGGKIWARSVFGEGTTISISLPIDQKN